MAIIPMVRRVAPNVAATPQQMATSGSTLNQAPAIINTNRQNTVLGRYTGPQLFDTRAIPFAGGQQPTYLSLPLFMEKSLERLTLQLTYRVTVTGAAYSVVIPEGPQNLLRKVLLSGNSGSFGNQEMWNISGSTLFALSHVYPGSGNGSYIEINGVRVDPPGLPFAAPWSLDIGTYDVRVVWQMPTAPYMPTGRSTRRQASQYIISSMDWGNTMRLECRFGDATSFGTPAGGTTVTITAFGSASGDPSLRVWENFAMLGSGPERGQVLTNGLVIRVEQTQIPLTAQGSQQRLAELNQKITTNVLVKSGTLLTSATGVPGFSALSNAQLENTKIVHGTTPIRDTKGNESYRAYYADAFGLPGALPEGYFPISFIETGGNIKNAYRADALEGGAQMYIATDVEEPGATNYQSVVQEIIVQGRNGGPFGPVVLGA